MPSFRVSVSLPVFESTKYVKDVKLACEKAVIEAAREVYRRMQKQIPFWTGFSQGAVSNIGDASVDGMTVGNIGPNGNFSSRLKSSASIRALIPGAKKGFYYSAKTRTDNHKAGRKYSYGAIERSFETGKAYGTPGADIIKTTLEGQIRFAFRANIDYWMQGKNVTWGSVTQYKELFVQIVLQNLKIPDPAQYITFSERK